MLSKLPGINSYRRGVRIFSRIYYVFLVLLFAMLMFRSRRGIGGYDKLINILEMFVLWLAFAVPVFVVSFMNNRGFALPVIVIAVCITALVLLTASMYAGNLYSPEYKAHFGTSLQTEQ